jgi:glucan endo-1,3-alpha-glucosidase
MQTWNDAGESHYMGNSWPEPIDGSDIGSYTAGYDHTGYWQILPAFIKAYKAGATTTDTMFPTNGAKAQGTVWHHTLLTSADCSADPIGKPQGANTIEDKVTVSSIPIITKSSTFTILTSFRLSYWSQLMQQI